MLLKEISSVGTLSSIKFFDTQKSEENSKVNWELFSETGFSGDCLNFLKFHVRNVTCPQASGQKVNIFKISKKYGVKPVAQQFRPQESLFLVRFRLPTLTISESRTVLGEGLW